MSMTDYYTNPDAILKSFEPLNNYILCNLKNFDEILKIVIYDIFQVSLDF